MYKIEIGDIEIDVIRKDIENLHLAVYPPHGRVRIAAPAHMSEDSIRLFATTKISWIRKQKQRFHHQERLPESEFVSGESHYFNGRRYLLNVINENTPSRVVLRHRHMDLYVRPGSKKEHKAKVVNQFFRQFLREQVRAFIALYESKMNLHVSEFGIKQMKTRWGTCNIQERRIWINLELAKKPINCLEYIVVHEMVHLIERQHTERFKSLMDIYLPNWRSLRDELNKLPVSYSDWSY